MSLSIPGYRYLFVAGGCFLGERGFHIRIALVLPLPPGRKRDMHAFDLDVHRWIAEREKAMSWSYPRKSWLFSVLDPSKEGFHRFIQTKIDFLQKFTVDVSQFRIVFTTLLQRLLGFFPSRPLLTVP